MSGLFLDTATQIKRDWGSPSVREEIEGQLADSSLYCSHYVKCQYKATLLNSIIGLHNLLLRTRDMNKALLESKVYKNKDIAGVHLTKGVQERMDEVGHWIVINYKSFEEQKQRLEDLIEDAWETMFNRGLKYPLINETNCLYAKDAPRLGVSGAYEPIEITCTKSTPQKCAIGNFWSEHRFYLEFLSNMGIDSIETVPKDVKEELERVKEHAQQISDGESPHGKRCTVFLSDAIICLESTHCPEKVSVHSINKKHFRPLCEVLGLESEPKD